MTSVQILNFLKSADLFLIYFAGLTAALLIIRHYSQSEAQESRIPWTQVLHATVHSSIWFLLARVLAFI